jgi:hypothetical protein
MADVSRSFDVDRRGWPEYLALIVGIVYGLVGIIGIVQTGFSGFAATEGAMLFGIFEVNPLHNLVHLGAGAALIIAFFAGRRTVVYVAGALAAIFVLLAVAGPFLTGTEGNILAMNAADHWLHLVTAAALAVASYGAARFMGERVSTGRDVRSDETRTRDERLRDRDKDEPRDRRAA